MFASKVVRCTVSGITKRYLSWPNGFGNCSKLYTPCGCHRTEATFKINPFFPVQNQLRLQYELARSDRSGKLIYATVWGREDQWDHLHDDKISANRSIFGNIRISFSSISKWQKNFELLLCLSQYLAARWVTRLHSFSSTCATSVSVSFIPSYYRSSC